MSSCKICARSDHAVIDAQLAAGISFRTIAANFPGISIGGVHRHKAHLRDAARTPQGSAMSNSSKRNEKLARRTESLLRAALRTLRTAQKRNDLRSSTQAVTAATRLIQLLAKFDSAVSAGAPAPTVDQDAEDPDEIELATVLARETKGFDAAEIERLKRIAAAADVAIAAPVRDNSGTADSN